MPSLKFIRVGGVGGNQSFIGEMCGWLLPAPLPSKSEQQTHKMLMALNKEVKKIGSHALQLDSPFFPHLISQIN